MTDLELNPSAVMAEDALGGAGDSIENGSPLIATGTFFVSSAVAGSVTPVQSSALPVFANSVTQSAQVVTLPTLPIGWNGIASFQQFNTNLGTLLEVILTVGETRAGSVAVENLSSAGASVTLSESASISVPVPGTTAPVVAIGQNSNVFNLGEYDGTIDFSGNSGLSLNLNQLSATNTPGQSGLIDDGALSAFTGTGTISLPVRSLGTSGVSGPGSLQSQVSQQVGGTVSVQYVYQSSALACFAAGTRIMTPDGEQPVEDLRVGQPVTRVRGGTARIIWIGYRTVDCFRHPDREAVLPVRIRAGALADQVPARDLLISPEHAIFADGVMIPARALIDGGAVAQLKVDQITYYHIELEQHDIVLAESLPVESYLDTGNRDDFANGGGATAAHPNFGVLAWETEGCAPLALTGPKVDAVRARIAARQSLVNGAVVQEIAA